MGSWVGGRRGRKGERGTTFVVMLVLLFATLSLTISALISATSGLRITSNYKTGAQALLAAEAGAVHAQSVIDDYGVVRFDTDIVDAWSSLFGTGARTVPGYPTLGYSVAASDDPVNPAAFMLLTATGAAPDEAERVVQLRLQRIRTFSPGAIWLPDPDVSTNFNGNSFLIDGNDTNLDGSPSTNDPVPGISTWSDEAAEAVRGTLSGAQVNNVIGLGSDPSVLAANGPSVDRLQNEIIENVIAHPSVVADPTLTGNDVFGTVASPQITHFSGSVNVTGTLRGAGILIVDQGFTISGDAEFVGLIVVRGETSITTISGHAAILGAIWTTDLALTVSGTASVTYSSQALALANGIDANEELLPQKIRAVSWNQI